MEQWLQQQWHQLMVEVAYYGPYLGRILLATALGAVLGLERERTGRPAGFRTFTMVAMGSALFTVVSELGFSSADSARVAANILTGIGFIGAGTVFRSYRERSDGQRSETVKGVTTAAALWACGAIAMAAGTGLYLLAIATTATAFLVLELLPLIEPDSR